MRYMMSIPESMYWLSVINTVFPSAYGMNAQSMLSGYANPHNRVSCAFEMYVFKRELRCSLRFFNDSGEYGTTMRRVLMTVFKILCAVQRHTMLNTDSLGQLNKQNENDGKF